MTPADARALAVGRALLALVAELAPAPAAPDGLLPLLEAARHAATSVRTVRSAIRAGELPAVGRQRDRAVRRADLDRWIESRRVRPVAGIDDADLEARMRRLSRACGAGR